MSFLADLEKGYNKVKAEIVKVVGAVPGVLAKLEQDAPEVEAVANVVFPGAGGLVAGALAFAEKAALALESTGSAAEQNFLNAGIDQATLNDFKALVPAIKALKK